MKMTPEDYVLLKTKIDDMVEKVGIFIVLDYKNRKLGHNQSMRFRWDLYWLADCHLIPAIKQYHDEHIDTALKKYIKEHPVLSKG